MVGTFGLERADAAFHQGVVIRVSGTAHGNGDADSFPATAGS